MNVKRFPCPECGAPVEVAPGARVLQCSACHFSISVPRSGEEISDLDFAHFVRLATLDAVPETRPVFRCRSCAAEFSADVGASPKRCIFCASTDLAECEVQNRLEPKSVLPFLIDAREASDAYHDWAKSCWLAPGELKRRAAEEGALTPVFIPYWTFRAWTTTYYTGERGADYTTEERYMTIEEGRRVVRTREVVRTDWESVEGVVWRSFDDVLVSSCMHVPEQHQPVLEGWDLRARAPFELSMVRGHAVLRCEVCLERGFERARTQMQPSIDASVETDIGGDRQRILYERTQLDRVAFEQMLAPVWVAAYRYAGRSYLYLVNGQTGEAYGEAPVSWRKSALFAFAFALILGFAIWLGAAR